MKFLEQNYKIKQKEGLVRVDTQHRTLVLAIIDAEEGCHANGIASIVRERFGRNIIGSLYALLHRLEEEKILTSAREGNYRTAKRTYYLTKKGEQELGKCRAYFGVFYSLLNMGTLESRKKSLLSA